jgi:large repetitive protein
MNAPLKRSAFGLAALTLGLATVTAALIASAAVAAPPPCQTKNVRTGIEYKGASALANAITDAASGDTINIWGTCYGNFRVNQTLTLSGKGKNATLDGNQTGRVLRIGGGTVTARDLRITNGKTTSLGGGIYVGTAAVLINVLVVGNEGGANNFGGGIEADFHSSLTLINSTVSGNTAGGSGGIDIFMAEVSLTNSTVSGNHATGATTDGCAFDSVIYSCAGGIWNYHGALALTNSVVGDNTADYRGGGMRNDATLDAGGNPTDGITILSGTTKISFNTAGNQGGGIWANVANGVFAADGTATYTDPISGATLPAWTGSITGNTPDQCSPTLTIGSTTCGT